MEIAICMVFFIIGIVVGMYISSQIKDDINNRTK